MPADQRANPFMGGASLVRSLNRARIVELRGVRADEGVAGQTGYELLSARSLRRQIADAADRLGLDPLAADLIRRFDACFDRPATRPAALRIARSYGRRLGCLLLMLKRGETANRAARPEWSDVHWDFWRGLSRVYMGGGLLAGRLGPHAVLAAQELLAEAAEDGLALEHAPHAAHLPLIGLARSAPHSAARMLLLDFGQTSIKRGLARYQAGQIAQIQVWPNAPAVCDQLLDPAPSIDMLRERWQRMLDVIAASWAAVPPAERTLTPVGISVACYLLDGHPAPGDTGCYGALQGLCAHLATFMRQEIAQRLGQAIELTALHDGTAAATTYAGHDRAVVITLGTAIGSGFPPPDTGLRPVDEQFALHESASEIERQET
jgi:hypothetical protein